MLVDSGGNFHVVIANSSLFDATNHDATWTLTALDQVDWVTQAAVAKDSKDHLHVLEAASPYGRDITQHDLIRYLTNTGGSWSATTLDDHGSDPAITVDRSDHLHVAYLWSNRTTTELRYATNAQGAWRNTTVFSAYGDESGDSYVAIAAMAPGAVYITWVSGVYFVRYLTNSGGTWTSSLLSQIPSSGGMYSPVPIALDSRGRVHVAYSAYSASTNTTYVVHAMDTDGTWTREPVGTVSGPIACSLVLDTSGNVHLDYVDANSGVLTYATNAGGSWSTRIVAMHAHSYGGNSIGLQPSGGVVIAYVEVMGGETSSPRFSVRVVGSALGWWNGADLLGMTALYLLGEFVVVGVVVWVLADPHHRRRHVTQQ